MSYNPYSDIQKSDLRRRRRPVQIIREKTRSILSGGSFMLLLALLFIALKLTGHIDWSWIWVLSPLWIPVALTICIVGAVIVGVVVFIFFVAGFAFVMDRR